MARGRLHQVAKLLDDVTCCVLKGQAFRESSNKDRCVLKLSTSVGPWTLAAPRFSVAASRSNSLMQTCSNTVNHRKMGRDLLMQEQLQYLVKRSSPRGASNALAGVQLSCVHILPLLCADLKQVELPTPSWFETTFAAHFCHKRWGSCRCS